MCPGCKPLCPTCLAAGHSSPPAVKKGGAVLRRQGDQGDQRDQHQHILGGKPVNCPGFRVVRTLCFEGTGMAPPTHTQRTGPLLGSVTSSLRTGGNRARAPPRGGWWCCCYMAVREAASFQC